MLIVVRIEIGEKRLLPDNITMILVAAFLIIMILVSLRMMMMQMNVKLMANGEDDDDTSCRILESSPDHGQGELPHRIRSSGEREIYLQTAFDLNGRKLC